MKESKYLLWFDHLQLLIYLAIQGNHQEILCLHAGPHDLLFTDLLCTCQIFHSPSDHNHKVNLIAVGEEFLNPDIQ